MAEIVMEVFGLSLKAGGSRKEVDKAGLPSERSDDRDRTLTVYSQRLRDKEDTTGANAPIAALSLRVAE